MNTKRMMRWCIVLFLLAALPVVTAVMAQGQESDVSQAPESVRYEIEPNSSIENADVIQLNDVITGRMDILFDRDFFKFYVSQANSMVLIDIDINPDSWLVPFLTLLDANGNELLTDHRDSREAMLFDVLQAGWYYVLVNDKNDEGGYGNNYNYELYVSSPLLISAAPANLGTGAVAGIQFRSEDILAWSQMNNGQEKWAMFFDGSDVYVKTLTNIAVDSTGNILFTVSANQTLPFLNTVTPWDIIAFHPEGVGEDTAGLHYSWHLQGRQWYLTTTAEKIDAIVSGFYTGVSTAGTATVPYYMGYNIKLQDEDLTWWSTADQEWYPDFDGSRVTGLAVEDVYAAARSSTKQFLTILGTGKIAGHKVTQKDIFAINNSGSTWGGLVWHGPDHGWNYNIDAFETTGW